MLKYNFFTLLVIFFSLTYPTKAGLEFYFGDGSVFRGDVITSSQYRWSHIDIRSNTRIEPILNDYEIVETIDIETFETFIQTHKQEVFSESEIPQLAEIVYKTYTDTEDQIIKRYIDLAVSQQVEDIIQDKIRNDVLLTSYEEKLINCEVSLPQRQAWIINLFVEAQKDDNSHSIDITDLDNITNCITPRTQVISESVGESGISEDIVAYNQRDIFINQACDLQIKSYNQLLEDWVISLWVYERLRDVSLNTCQHLQVLHTISLTDDTCFMTNAPLIIDDYDKKIADFYEMLIDWNINYEDYVWAIMKLNTLILRLHTYIENCSEWIKNKEKINNQIEVLGSYYRTIYDRWSKDIEGSWFSIKNTLQYLILLFLSTAFVGYIFYFKKRLKIWK